MLSSKNENVVNGLLKNYHYETYSLEIVSSVKSRLGELGYHERDDTRIAVTLYNEKKLLLKNSIVDADKRSIIQGMLWRGKFKVTETEINEKIGDMKKFFVHTILHEIAHMKGLTQEQEKEADDWAFDRLSEIEPIFFNQIDIT